MSCSISYPGFGRVPSSWLYDRNWARNGEHRNPHVVLALPVRERHDQRWFGKHGREVHPHESQRGVESRAMGVGDTAVGFLVGYVVVHLSSVLLELRDGGRRGARGADLVQDLIAIPHKLRDRVAAVEPATKLASDSTPTLN